MPYVLFILIFVFLIRLRIARSTLFPYTTLFRSQSGNRQLSMRNCPNGDQRSEHELFHQSRVSVKSPFAPRSEEHTSELQSPCNLVCRHLLEKKKLQKRFQLSHRHLETEIDYQ